MATFTWNIIKMSNYPNSQGQVKMVFNVEWTCVGLDVDDNSNPISQEILGSTAIAYNPNHTWIPYENLTLTEVLDWLWEAGVNQATIEEILGNRLAGLKTPAQDDPLPW